MTRMAEKRPHSGTLNELEKDRKECITMRKITSLKKRLLQEVQKSNKGLYSPSKANVVAFDNCGDAYSMNSQTRSYRYRIIDELIRQGLLHNASPVASRYALVITETGKRELS